MNLVLRPSFGMIMGAILLGMSFLGNLGVTSDPSPLSCDVVLEISASQYETNTFVLDTELVQDKVRHVLIDRLGLQANTIESVSISYQLEEPLDSKKEEEDLLVPSVRRRLRKNRKPNKKKPNKPKKEKAPMTIPQLAPTPAPNPWPPGYCHKRFGCYTPPPNFGQLLDDDDDDNLWNSGHASGWPSHWRSAGDHDERKLQPIDQNQELKHEDLQNRVCKEVQTLHDGYSGLRFESCSLSLNCRNLGSVNSLAALA